MDLLANLFIQIERIFFLFIENEWPWARCEMNQMLPEIKTQAVSQAISQAVFQGLERHWVGINQFVMLMFMTSLFSPISYLKLALQPYFKAGAMDTPLGLMLSLVQLVVLMKAPGSHVAIEIMPALLGCLMMMLCVIALSQILGRAMATLLKELGVIRFFNPAILDPVK
jgi:hypothetical protein